MAPKWIILIRADSDARQSFEEFVTSERSAALEALAIKDDPDARAYVRMLNKLRDLVVSEEREAAQLAGYRRAAGISNIH
jgi:hypothetical protein